MQPYSVRYAAEKELNVLLITNVADDSNWQTFSSASDQCSFPSKIDLHGLLQ